MARKLKPTVAAAEPVSAAGDHSALLPDVALTVAGRAITVREYGFFEGLEVANRAAAFIADMQAQCADGSMTYAGVRRLFGKHQACVVDIAAQAAGVEPDWLSGLGAADAELFMSTWFAVNCGFFMHELVVQMQVQQHQTRSHPTGSASSPDSAAPGSAISTVSPGSRNVN